MVFVFSRDAEAVCDNTCRYRYGCCGGPAGALAARGGAIGCRAFTSLGSGAHHCDCFSGAADYSLREEVKRMLKEMMSDPWLVPGLVGVAYEFSACVALLIVGRYLHRRRLRNGATTDR